MHQVKKKPHLCLLIYQRPSRPTEASTSESGDVLADVTLNKYLAAINKHDFSYDDQPNVFALQLRNTSHRTHYSADCLAFLPRLLLWNVFFSQWGIIMRPHRSRIGDDLLETLLDHRRNVMNRGPVCVQYLHDSDVIFCLWRIVCYCY